MTLIHIIHENDAWTAPLETELKDLDQPFVSWFLDRGHFDLSQPPPEGIFYNRMSASSHTRDHRYAHEYTSAVIAWLEQYGRRVLNGTRANQLEVTKVGQYAALAKYGVATPRTLPALGRDHVVEAARSFEGAPFITKHNRAGKGLGVHLFRSVDALETYLDGPTFEEPVDGITLIQQYIEAPEPFITRVEFVGQQFLYAVRVDTSEGFELCPADACSIEGQNCPATPQAEAARPKFEIIEGFESPLIEKYQQFMRDNDFQIAAFEFIVDRDGNPYTYDVNQNTNYNSAAEAVAKKYGMRSIAKLLTAELARHYGRATAAA